MKRFDKTTLEGNEARLNHGDSERVRLKEDDVNEIREANEAYHLMQYKCDTCGIRSLIWNSRDAVTPFMCGCSCGGKRNHINWKQDVRMIPEYIPPPGYCDVFIDLSPESAKELAIKRVDSFAGSEFEPKKGSAKYDEMVRKLTESYVNDCCSVDIISSEEYGKLCGSGP